MSKQDKRPKTLLEYMGFKDPDIDNPQHDDIIDFITKKENFQKFFFHFINSGLYDIQLLRGKHYFVKPNMYFYNNENDYSQQFELPCKCNIIEHGDRVRRFLRLHTNYTCELHNKKPKSERTNSYNSEEHSIQNIPFFQKEFIGTFLNRNTLTISIPYKIQKTNFRGVWYTIENLVLKTEFHLADNYRPFGFLDVCFNFDLVENYPFSDTVRTKGFCGFIEVKTKSSTFTKELREIEFYKDKILNHHLHGFPWHDLEYRRNKFYPILISPTNIPEQFKEQVYHFTFEQIKEMCRA